MKKFTILETQKGIKIRSGKIESILEPGSYWSWRRNSNIEVHDIVNPTFISTWSDAIVANHPKLMEKYFRMADPNDKQVAIVWKSNKFYRLVEPGQRLVFWNVLEEIRIEYVDISEFEEIPSEKVRTLLNKAPNSQQFLSEVVPDGSVGILYVDGKLIKTLLPGAYGYWRGRAFVKVVIINLKLQNIEVSGQEILTKDKVSLRVNFEAFYRIRDVQKVLQFTDDFKSVLYKEFQFALRKQIGTRTLDEILSWKECLAKEINPMIQEQIEGMGIEITSSGLKDIILPGEMKEILNQVVSAEKKAQANLVRRREEVAATRALLNTAKMIDSNPTLMRLKELEALEKMSEKVSQINVGETFGSLLNQMNKK